jgi:sugar-specific transcriptional regulator TrmB
MKYTETLTSIGLTTDQAKIYETLLSMTVMPARLISQKSLIGRELTYVVLGQLEKLDLVERSTQGKIILFKAKHPRNVKKILEEKKEEVLIAEKAYQNSILNMVNEFSKMNDMPFVRFYSGVEGLQKTYDHIIRHSKQVYVFRSLFDYENQEIRKMVTDQIQKQAQKKIRSYVLSPYLPHMSDKTVSHNLEKNITRKILPKNSFVLPAQIIIYNDTVSITSMEKEMITTIIENKAIAQTFLALFNYIWNSIE